MISTRLGRIIFRMGSLRLRLRGSRRQRLHYSFPSLAGRGIKVKAWRAVDPHPCPLPKGEGENPVISSSSRGSACGKRLTQPANLGGVIVGVGRVNFQPVFGRVRAAFGMRAFALPIFIAHEIEELRRGCARAPERVQRWTNLTLVVVQASGISVLIVALNQRMVFRDQATQAESTGGLAV